MSTVTFLSNLLFVSVLKFGNHLHSIRGMPMDIVFEFSDSIWEPNFLSTYFFVLIYLDHALLNLMNFRVLLINIGIFYYN